MKRILSFRKLLLLCVCLSLLMIFSCAVFGEDEDMRQKFESGMDYAYSENPDYVRAVAAFTPPAKSGFPRAALELGNIYREGAGSIKQDLKAAESWYLSALEAGNLEAGLELGILYEFYIKDSDTAKKYYEQYQNSGFLDSNTALLTMLYMKSARLGDASSQYEMGICYENGTGVNADNRKAFYWFLKAANNGYSDAKTKISEMYTSGTGVSTDAQKALEWQTKADNGEITNTAAPEVDRIIETVRNAQLGDVLYFGHYEQDNNNINGLEELKWKVINKQSNSSLLISYYGIDTLPYNSRWESTTWENSTLREWLNGEFYENAFSEAEKSLIQESEVKAMPNTSWNTLGGNNTMDRIFLLNIQEAEEYFDSLSERTCEATAYAKAKKAYINSGKSLWWLRSTGMNYFTVVAVNSDGSITAGGSRINYEGNVVRPVMWLTY